MVLTYKGPDLPVNRGVSTVPKLPEFDLMQLNLLELARQLKDTINSSRPVIFKGWGNHRLNLDLERQRLIIQQIDGLGLASEVLARTQAKVFLGQQLFEAELYRFEAQLQLEARRFKDELQRMDDEARARELQLEERAKQIALNDFMARADLAIRQRESNHKIYVETIKTHSDIDLAYMQTEAQIRAREEELRIQRLQAEGQLKLDELRIEVQRFLDELLAKAKIGIDGREMSLKEGQARDETKLKNRGIYLQETQEKNQFSIRNKEIELEAQKIASQILLDKLRTNVEAEMTKAKTKEQEARGWMMTALVNKLLEDKKPLPEFLISLIGAAVFGSRQEITNDLHLMEKMQDFILREADARAKEKEAGAITAHSQARVDEETANATVRKIKSRFT